ncbi:MAG TPA: hypothetical protein VHV55_04835 [Pirellulales bacterium]|jgi:hypothetical protein|nr:hypothetical protein [Pirellulales bacterium]
MELISCAHCGSQVAITMSGYASLAMHVLTNCVATLEAAWLAP